MNIPGFAEASEIMGQFAITIEAPLDSNYHLTDPDSGRTFWTAIERPLVPPKSLGEVCIEEAQNSIAHWADYYGVQLSTMAKYTRIDLDEIRRALYRGDTEDRIKAWAEFDPPRWGKA